MGHHGSITQGFRGHVETDSTEKSRDIVNRSPDLPAEDARAALHALSRANQHLLASIDELSHDQAQAPSRLPNWNRANIVTHLAYVGRALVRMTDEALESGSTATYPKGPSERASSIQRGKHLPTDLLRKEITEAMDDLDRRWSIMTESDWDTDFTLNGQPDTRLTRLLMQRWTEIEVHTSDLGFDGDGFDVSELFVAAALPLRVAWLVKHHRSRVDADRSVHGIWQLKASTSRQAWTIKTSTAADQCSIEGSNRELLGFLLGRIPVDQLTVEGNVGLAHRFKLAFPGP